MNDSREETAAPGTPEAPRAQSVWRRYVVSPIINQLKQGATPDKIAESMAWGGVIGCFPILGTTTTLCGIAAIYLRLNHIATQVVNWLVYPIQVLLIIPYIELGNLLFGIPPVTLSLNDMVIAFETDFIGSVKEMGWLALRGVAAWALCAIPSAFLLTRALRPVTRRLAADARRQKRKEAADH